MNIIKLGVIRLAFFIVLVSFYANCKGQRNVPPDWVLKKHQGSFSTEYDSYESEVLKYVVLNDSISYCIKKQNTNTCEKDFIIIFNKRSEAAEYELGRQCDHDLSRPNYRWKEYKMLSDTNFRVFEIVERVPREFVDENGMVKQEFDYYEIQNKTRDTVTTFLVVDRSGRLSY